MTGDRYQNPDERLIDRLRKLQNTIPYSSPNMACIGDAIQRIERDADLIHAAKRAVDHLRMIETEGHALEATAEVRQMLKSAVKKASE